MDQLKHARQQIDAIDRQMAALFAQRMQAVCEVAAYKKEHGLPVLDASREQQVLTRNAAHLEEENLLEYYLDFQKNVMRISRRYQKDMLDDDIVGYQGTEGAFSHIAMKQVFGECKNQAYPTFEEVFCAVEKGEIRYGVIPFENSYTGEVGEVLDLLWQHDVHIQGVYDLAISQNLLALPGAKLEEITRVYSKTQALGQCQDFIRAHAYEAVAYPNTALAAKFVSESGDCHIAAIASEETAALYGLSVLVRDINTSAQNTTRFIIIGNRFLEEGNRFNLLFTVDHRAGQLARVMQIIGEYGYNLESIKSRPLHNLPWQYYFYVEIVGSLKDEKTAALLAELRNNCKDLKVLGAYTVE